MRGANRGRDRGATECTQVPPVTDASVSAHVQLAASLSPSFSIASHRKSQQRAIDMSEDRPADDQGEGVDAAVGLPSDVLQELVGPVRRKPPPRLHDPPHDAPC